MPRWLCFGALFFLFLENTHFGICWTCSIWRNCMFANRCSWLLIFRFRKQGQARNPKAKCSQASETQYSRLQTPCFCHPSNPSQSHFDSFGLTLRIWFLVAQSPARDLELTYLQFESVWFAWADLDPLLLHWNSCALNWPHVDRLWFPWNLLESVWFIWIDLRLLWNTWTHVNGHHCTLWVPLKPSQVHFDAFELIRSRLNPQSYKRSWTHVHSLRLSWAKIDWMDLGSLWITWSPFDFLKTVQFGYASKSSPMAWDVVQKYSGIPSFWLSGEHLQKAFWPDIDPFSSW